MPNGAATPQRIFRNIPQEAREEIERATPIALPFFIMLLFFAVMLDLTDLIEAIPFIGSILAFLAGAIGGAALWSLYWLAGARGLVPVATMILSWILEEVPVVSFLPINSLTVILVYFLSRKEVLRTIGVGLRIAEKLPQTRTAARAARAAGVGET